MRRMVWPLIAVAALALAGCNAPNSSQQNAGNKDAGKPTAAAATNTVSGTIALREPGQLSADAKLVISLDDVSATAGATTVSLVSKTIAPAQQFPQSFELTFNPTDVNPHDLYVVQAVLTDGDRHYSMPLQAPVLTKGASNQVSIQLAAEQTPGEKVLAAFNTVKAQIGGMKVSNGTRLEANVSRGWQVFRQAGEVKFIRELVDYGDKGFTSTDYAYQDGKPWVVVQQKKSDKDAKPNSIDRAGWDKDGALVLKQNVVGSATHDLGADVAADLNRQAVVILSLATGGKGK